MYRRLFVVFIVICGLDLPLTQSLVTQLKLTIIPEHAHISPSNDVNILCKADAPLTHCNIKVRGNRVYDLSEGYFTPTDKEFTYFGEGLEKGDCGVTLRGEELHFVVYVVGCRARSKTSDWVYADMGLINKYQTGLNVTFSPGRTLVILPGDPFNVLVDAHIPLSKCVFVFTNDYGKTNNKLRYNFEDDKYNDNPNRTDMSYYGTGLKNGQCGFQVTSATELHNDGAFIDVIDPTHEETLFFRLIIARSPGAPTLTYDTSRHFDGSVDLNAMCSVRSRPSAKLAWYLGGERISDDNLQFIHKEEWTWPSNIQTVQQKLTMKVNISHDGKELWCTAEHFTIQQPKESKREAIHISSPPGSPILEVTSTQFSEGAELKASCLINNYQPDARITWYLGNEIMRRDNEDDEPDSLNTKKSITQKFSHLLRAQDNGLDLRCEVAHVLLSQPLYATSTIRFTLCSPLTSASLQISCFLAGEQVDCAQSQEVGTQAQLACKPGYWPPSSIVYRKVTCLRIVRWDRPLFSCIPVCGKRNTNSGTVLISGGEDSKIGEFPWHIGIYEMTTPTKDPVQICGGTLISPNIIVSAAHCFWSDQSRKAKNATKIKIAAGKHIVTWEDIDLNVQKRDVSQIIIPLRYSGRVSQFASDIALLRLSVAIEITATVNMVCVDWDNVIERNQLREGNLGVVAGWGYTEHGTQSNMLKYVNLPYVAEETCSRALSKETEQIFTHDKFCAGYVNQSTSVCRGDSGGGLVFRDPGTDKYYLRGIVSIAFTPPSNNAICYSQLYTAFTKFSQFINWVQEKV